MAISMRGCLLVMLLTACGEGNRAASAPPAGGSVAFGSTTGGSAAVAGNSGISAGGAGLGGLGEVGVGGSAGSVNGGAGRSSGGGAAVGNFGGSASSTDGSASGSGGSASGSGGSSSGSGGAAATLNATAMLQVLDRVNAQFVAKWPDPGKPIDASHPSTIWTRAVYYEGLLALQTAAPQKKYYDYALAWGTSHSWQLRDNDSNTTSADNQCAGQTYIDLYQLDGANDPVRIAAIQQSIDGMVRSASSNAWTWVDAIQMSMPVFARLGALRGDPKYFDKMHALYADTKLLQGGGLYNTTDHLWWRDAIWKPKKTPSGKQTYWARGNGWVFAALARVLSLLPATDAHRAEYEQDFKAMAVSLLARQRVDGFWNVNLDDPEQYGGPEVSGTSLFVYGMAWGVRNGLLSEATYGSAAAHAWNAMVQVAVHDTGFLGYMQPTGDDPSDGQPLSYDKVPDYEDYGVGCFLLAGSELVRWVQK